LDWREEILQQFVPQVANLTAVLDPDHLLAEEELQQAIRARGFVLLTYDDPLSFRYQYEVEYRPRWERGERLELVVIAHSDESYRHLPYDLWATSRKLEFSLAELFPHLSPPVVAELLNRADLSKLYAACHQNPPSARLGQEATRRYILKQVYGIVPEQLNQPADLFRLLLRRHYEGQKLPASYGKYLESQLAQKESFRDWQSLLPLISDQAAFFEFVQGQWPHFVEKWATQQKIVLDEESQHRIAESRAAYSLDLPFDSPEARIYIDNYFVEGLLKPLELASSLPLADKKPGDSAWWVSLGLRENRPARLEKLLDILEKSLPGAGEEANGGKVSPHGDWLHFAYRWAELLNLKNSLSVPELPAKFAQLQQRMDTTFLAWVQNRYSGLPSLYPRPVMLHHVPEILARQSSQSKIALVVLDGLALDQWLLIQQGLSESQPGKYRFQQEALFAWLPTLTSVSRQALFSGKPPFLFADSLGTTNKEEKLWKQFWQNSQNLSGSEVAYQRNLGQAPSLEEVALALEHPKLKVLGLVVNTVDDLMHGAILGSAGIYSQIRQWLQQGFLATLLDMLLAEGFEVYLTSDHGNIEASGIGKPNEGSLAETRGERVRIYSDNTLRNRTSELFPESINWQDNGLPENYFALFAPARKAFVSSGEVVVAHGGISLEELIVPFIKITRG